MSTNNFKVGQVYRSSNTSSEYRYLEINVADTNTLGYIYLINKKKGFASKWGKYVSDMVLVDEGELTLSGRLAGPQAAEWRKSETYKLWIEKKLKEAYLKGDFQFNMYQSGMQGTGRALTLEDIKRARKTLTENSMSWQPSDGISPTMTIIDDCIMLDSWFKEELEQLILKDLTKLIEEDDKIEQKLAIKAANAPFYVCWVQNWWSCSKDKHETLEGAKIEAEGILKNASGIEEVFIMKKYLTAKRSKPTFTKSGV
jgi:hypothetical protein